MSRRLRKRTNSLWQQTIEFWQQLGSRTLHVMTPAQHDQTLAATSHLPHLLASVLAAATPDAALPFASTGWLDTTRVAAGDPELWTQILQQNQTEVRQSLSHFQSVLEQFSQALEQDQWETLAQILALGKTQRDALGS
ncbi:MAG: prephenate dehydrogenase dimerization domain-containing protein [Pirellulaceae bacterium]